MCHPEFFRMTILTSVLTALTGWVAHLAARLVPSSAKNECDRVAYHGPAAEASVDTNGDDKHLKKYFIPNVIATWPWPRRLNQHHVEVIAESAAWIASFKPFNPKAQESFDRCRSGKTWRMMLLLMCSHPLSGLLGCLAYPNFTKGESLLRVYQHWTY
jgi:hypothetical protein